MHEKHKDQLPLPQARWSHAKKNEETWGQRAPEDFKTWSTCNINHKTTQNKNNIGTTTSEWSVAKTSRGFKIFLTPQTSPWVPMYFLIQKYIKRLHNGSQTQSVHHSEDSKSIDKLINMMKQRQVVLAKSKPTASQSERKPLAEPRRAEPKT